MIIRKSSFCFLYLILTSHINYAFRAFNVDGMATVLAVKDENITFECKRDIAMSYCGFIHPNGSRYSFSGADLIAGRCSIKIMVSDADNGEWQCHIGQKHPGLETVQKKYIRVADKLAALRQNFTTLHGEEFTIHCATAETMVPLSYCRFEPPSGSAFNIDPTVTSKKPIMGRYYFPQNLSLDRGDCGVTVKKARFEDAGQWTCGAGLEDGKEYIDQIIIHVEGLYKLSTASATGIVMGIIIIIVILALLGINSWRKRQSLTISGQEGMQETIEIDTLPHPTISTPHGTPQFSREIPRVVVEPPSEPSTSPVPS